MSSTIIFQKKKCLGGDNEHPKRQSSFEFIAKRREEKPKFLNKHLWFVPILAQNISGL